MTLLLTGGAGYIGSHVTRYLIEAGHTLHVLDNLSSGFEWAIAKQAKFLRGDVRDAGFLKEVFSSTKYDGVLHFAALTQVGESMQEPLKYYDVNTLGTTRLVKAMHDAGVKRFIYSSTAAVYGAGHAMVKEDALLRPMSPYGQSKLFSEQALNDLVVSDPEFRVISLRYFNVAGAHPDGQLGQATANATHLIKVTSEVACGKRRGLEIFGTDYATSDGTCVRDYIHVWDLAAAHALALESLSKKDLQGFEVFNVGYGRGYSVREVIAAVEKVSGKKLAVKEVARRAGDIPSVVADTTRIRERLGFRPSYDNLEAICATALKFEQNRQ